MVDPVRAQVDKHLYPFRSHFLCVPGGRLHYIDEGPRNGLTLLMVHGNPTWSFYYRELILALRSEFRVVAFDHLGCGLSDKPANYTYDLANHIDNADALVRHLDLEQIVLVLHDWGGAIGMGLARKQKERLAGFVVFNSAAFRSTMMPWRIALCRLPGFGPFAIRGLNAFLWGLLRFGVKKPERINQAIRAAYLAPYFSWQNRIALWRFVEDIPMRETDRSYATLLQIEADLSTLTQLPMLLVWGAGDFVFTRDFFAEWCRRFPEAEAVCFEDAGHLVVEDAHEKIIPLMRAHLAKIITQAKGAERVTSRLCAGA